MLPVMPVVDVLAMRVAVRARRVGVGVAVCLAGNKRVVRVIVVMAVVVGVRMIVG